MSGKQGAKVFCGEEPPTAEGKDGTAHQVGRNPVSLRDGPSVLGKFLR